MIVKGFKISPLMLFVASLVVGILHLVITSDWMVFMQVLLLIAGFGIWVYDIAKGDY